MAFSGKIMETIIKEEIGIESENLSLWYGKFQALFNVYSRISHGKITALIGPSGCGKTTLLRCFNRMNERFSNVKIDGYVRIMQKNIYDPDVSLIELRKTVGMVFQRPNPMPISIYDNVAFGLKIHTPAGHINKRKEREMVELALHEAFLLEEVKNLLNKKATDLPLEQQQKLCIARLIPLNLKVLLMDEPCSALDAEATEAIEDLLRSLRQKYTIVIVTHNMAQARRISDECIFMLNGRLIEHGQTAELFVTPKDKRTEEYIEGRYG